MQTSRLPQTLGLGRQTLNPFVAASLSGRMLVDNCVFAASVFLHGMSDITTSHEVLKIQIF